jgi:hypothetical protein
MGTSVSRGTGVRRQPGAASGGRRYGAFAEHPVLLAKGYAFGGGGRAGGEDGGGDADDRGDERYERPGAVAIEKLGGRPAGSGDGVDDGATMATTSAPPNWDDVLRRGQGGRCGERTGRRQRRRGAGERGQRSAATAGGASGRAHLPFLPRACDPTSGAGRRPGRSDGATLSPGPAPPSRARAGGSRCQAVISRGSSGSVSGGERWTAPGDIPTVRLNARLNAASDS